MSNTKSVKQEGNKMRTGFIAKDLGCKCFSCRKHLNIGELTMVNGDTLSWSCSACGSEYKVFATSYDGTTKLDIFRHKRGIWDVKKAYVYDEAKSRMVEVKSEATAEDVIDEFDAGNNNVTGDLRKD